MKYCKMRNLEHNKFKTLCMVFLVCLTIRSPLVLYQWAAVLGGSELPKILRLSVWKTFCRGGK